MRGQEAQESLEGQWCLALGSAGAPYFPRSGAACFAGSRSHSATLDTKAALSEGSKLPVWATLSHSVSYQQKSLSLEMRSHLIHCLLDTADFKHKASPAYHFLETRLDT